GQPRSGPDAGRVGRGRARGAQGRRRGEGRRWPRVQPGPRRPARDRPRHARPRGRPGTQPGLGAVSAAPLVAVVGGGITGMAAAYRLRTLFGDREGITVFEASRTLGGDLQTAELAGRPLDVGAEAFLWRRPELTELAAEIGLDGELVHPTAAGPRLRAG